MTFATLSENSMDEKELEKQRTNVDMFTEGLLTNLKRKLEGQDIDHVQLDASIRAVGEAVRGTVGVVTPIYMAAALMSYGEALDMTFKAGMQAPQPDGGRIITEDVVDNINTAETRH